MSRRLAGGTWGIAAEAMVARFGGGGVGRCKTGFETPREPDRFQEHSGHRSELARVGPEANDPPETLAVRCSNGFHLGFSPIKIFV
jgi:hypothetical protein